MATTLRRVLTYGKVKPIINPLHDSLITLSQEVTCQIKNLKSPLLQGL